MFFWQGMLTGQTMPWLAKVNMPCHRPDFPTTQLGSQDAAILTEKAGQGCGE
jgi:hypothetical protein